MTHTLSWLRPNVIFLLISLVLVYGFVWRLPARLPKSLACIVMAFSEEIAIDNDNLFGVKPLDLYDGNETSKFDTGDWLTWFLYPGFGYLFIYFYDRLAVRGPGIAVYVLACSLIGTGYEGLTVLFDVFKYKGWKLYDSFIVYFIVQLMTIILFELMKKGAFGHAGSRSSK